jgi:arylsulfatase A-like enzyme
MAEPRDFMDQTGPAAADAGRDPARPNVLLICCDHLRADWLGCNGHPIVMTPQLDKLAAAGANFRGAFSECPVCVPARRILMTGLNPYGIQMRQNVDTQPFPQGPKLAEVLTRAGYQSFAAGKLHVWPQRNRIGFEEVQLNEEGRRQGGLKQDDYEAFLADAGHGHLAWSHGLGNNQYGLRLNPLPEKLSSTHWTAQKAMEFIERRDTTRPFFLYVSFDKPHPPIVPPAEYYELYRDTNFPAPVQGNWLERKTPSRIRQVRLNNNFEDWARHPLMIQQSLRGFAAMITHIDSMIGAIVGQLREHGLFNNTWIVFTSDHGDQLFDHGNLAKGDFFCGSTNVPLLVIPPTRWRQQNGVAPGQVNRSTPAGLMDLMPTILEACGVPAPGGLHGQSLLPLLRDPGAAFRPYTCGVIGRVYGLSDGHYKYQWFSDDNLEFLFDQQQDPRDCHDLAEDPAHRGTLDRCRQQLLDWMSAHGDPQAKDGRLVPVPRTWDVAEAKATNNWNNRGRH